MGLRTNKVEKPVEETEETYVPEEEAYVPEEEIPADLNPEVPATVVQAAHPAVSTAQYPTLQECKNYIDLSKMQLKRIVGSNGQLQLVINKTTKIGLGEWIDANVFSYSKRWMVTPIKDPRVKIDSAKYCKASFDGKTVYDGLQKKQISIDEYTDQISDKFPNGTKVEEYLDLVVMVFDAEKSGDKAKEEAVIQVSVSPTSIKEFDQYLLTCLIRVMQGKVPATHQCCLRVTANKQTTTDGQDYVTMSFGAIPLDVVMNYKPLYMPKQG